MRKNIARVLLLSLTLSAISPMQDADAATKLTLSNKSISIKVGATKTVKANKTVKWKTSNKKIATVKKLSKKKAKITAKKAGSCKITAIAGKKKATIRVTVKKASNPTKQPTVTVKPTSTAKATATPVSTPSATIAPTATAVVSTPSASAVVSATAIPTAIPTATVSSSIAPEATEVVTVEPTATTAVKTPEPTATVEPTATTAVTTPEPTTTVTSAEPTATTVAASAEPITTLEPTVTPVTTPITISASGISMTLDSYENGKLTYTIENQSDDDMQYDYGYRIERENNGEWVQVQPDRMTNIPAVILNLSSGSKVSETESIKEAYDLEQGSYRFVKILYSKNCKCVTTLKLPFEVTNTIVCQEGISMTLDSYENGILEYTVENQSGDKIWYSIYEYTISKDVDGEWVRLAPDPYQPIPDVIEILENGKKDSYTENMLGEFDITPGKYRFTLYFKNGVCLSLPFEIAKTTAYQSGVAMTLDNYADGVITYTIENIRYNEEIGYSRDDYTLQKESNGEWVTLEPVRPILMRKESVTLAYKKSDTQTVNLALGYDLEPGNYRFVKSFGGQGDIALPFEVTKENTKVTPVIVSQSAVSVVLGGYENGVFTYMITNQRGKKIRYSYEGIGVEMNNGEWGLIELAVPKTDGTDGEVEADMTKKNKVQLDLSSGSYYYIISFTMEGTDGVDTQEFTLRLPFEVE